MYNLLSRRRISDSKRQIAMGQVWREPCWMLLWQQHTLRHWLQIQLRNGKSLSGRLSVQMERLLTVLPGTMSIP